MRRRAVLLATASLVYSSPSVFSVHDDLLAFPQVSVLGCKSSLVLSC